MQPHSESPVLIAGQPLESARAVMIMIHGRGAGARDILGLAGEFDRDDIAFVAPEAHGATWYPYSFMSPREMNEPGISSGLFVIESLVTDMLERGFESRNIFLLGFSQGACLSSEYVIRHPRRYGGLFALSGGLIGPPGTSWTDVSANLEEMPAFLGCSDIDPHIPMERVLETEQVLKKLGADVIAKIYPRMGHTINSDEILEVRRVLDKIE